MQLPSGKRLMEVKLLNLFFFFKFILKLFSGNWVSVEIATRRLAADRNLNLQVFTGTHGVTNLWNEQMQWREIFLDHPERRLPAPMIFYKIVVNNNSGAVVIGVNNFHLTLEQIQSRGYIVCNNVLDRLSWMSTGQFNPNNLRRGFTYACEVQDFLRAVPHITTLGHVTNLLI